jgi:heme-binding NEAT domain protein
MTIEQRLTFINAGYTKAEIAAMEAVENPEQPKPAEPEQPKPAEPEQPTPAEPTPGNDNKAVLDAIAALTAAIQLSNVQKTGVDSPGTLTATDALAQGVFGNK